MKWDPSKPWRCQHCTFINEAGSRICLICCKTTFREQSPAAKSDDEERQKKRAGFQDTLADKEIELSSIKNDADPPGKSEATPAAPDSESKPIPSADDDNQVNFTDDFIKEQQEVEKVSGTCPAPQLLNENDLVHVNVPTMFPQQSRSLSMVSDVTNLCLKVHPIINNHKPLFYNYAYTVPPHTLHTIT